MRLLDTESTEAFLSGGGEMGKLIRSLDWSETPLGPVESWPQSLRTSVSLCLSSTFPILIAWGPETIQIYNDSYRPICGAKHPESMGMNFRICWETALEVVGDAFTRGEHGEGTYINNQRMMLDRFGYLEEAWMTFSFAPIRDESGDVGGIFHPITETTLQMLSARRTKVLRELGADLGQAKTVNEIGRLSVSRYTEYNLDLPFLLFYKVTNGTARLISNAGLDAESPLVPAEIDIASGMCWPLAVCHESSRAVTVDNLEKQFGRFACEPYEEPPHTAMILPVKLSGRDEPAGFLIAGVSARRALDADYLNFYDQLANTFSTAVSNVYAYEQEQKRAEALAEIDRSKTAFFNNVSHEFRTPLTLMLGPLEDLLRNGELPQPARVPIEATHRNALRLLKLVNNLLDYSRVEAGRVQASYELTDLSQLTTDLASSFRSIIEKAGMSLLVHTPVIHEPVYTDRQMWEKIVLNLLSNAFKYTLEGTISVELKEKDKNIVLSVQDTGVGIPEKELPFMFQRFHRVENTAGRTHEGTGIGLSLVNELVQLHGGRISVFSEEGKGSTFTVSIPSGKDHLPQDKIRAATGTTDNSALKGAFIKEASSLLDENPLPETESLYTEAPYPAHAKSTRILIVDDNADMRAYLKRLLDPHFICTTAINGSDALAKIPVFQPDIVLSDLMMPVMDGKEMLHRIREDESKYIPVIFLSARAGEEARIDGLEAGADDYLVKPFPAAELLAKVHAQINIARARGLAEKELRELNDTLHLAMDASNMGIWRTVWGSDLLEVSPRARLIHGLHADKTLSFDATLEVVVPEHRERLLDAIRKAVETKAGFSEEYQIQPADGGKRKWINSTGKVEMDNEGNVLSVVGTIIDITESKEDELRKNDFIGMVSHELKTPLTLLHGYTQMLQMNADRSSDSMAMDKLEKMDSQIRRMTTLINGFLNVSGLDSGKIPMVKTGFDFTALVRQVSQEIEFKGTGHSIEFDNPGPVMIEADRDKIASVISNLVSNAIKYSPKRTKITLAVNNTPDRITFSVTDEGIGINAGDRQKLFSRYYRVVNSETQSITGFGIGLYLSNEIIERHRGRIWVDSTPGKGSTFYFSVPK